MKTNQRELKKKRIESLKRQILFLFFVFFVSVLGQLVCLFFSVVVVVFLYLCKH